MSHGPPRGGCDGSGSLPSVVATPRQSGRCRQRDRRHPVGLLGAENVEGAAPSGAHRKAIRLTGGKLTAAAMEQQTSSRDEGERLRMAGAHDTEIADVQGGQRGDLTVLGDGDNAGVDLAEPPMSAYCSIKSTQRA